MNDAIINTQVGCMVPNTRDKAGRGIVYVHPPLYLILLFLSLVSSVPPTPSISLSFPLFLPSLNLIIIL